MKQALTEMLYHKYDFILTIAANFHLILKTQTETF